MSEAFLPSPEGADAVLRAARRRRTAKASSFATSALAAVIGVTLLATGGGGAGRVRPDELTTTTSPSPAATATETATPQARASSDSVPAASQQASPLDPVLGTGTPGPTSPPSPQRRSTTKRTSPITRSYGTIAQTDVCSDGSADLQGTYCVRAFDPGVIHRGKSVRLGGEFCVTSPTQSRTLQLSSTREADIEVDGATTLWQGGEGLTYRSPGPAVTIAPGHCVVWTSVWDTRDRDGFVVPPGTYYLSFGVAADIGAVVSVNLTVED